MSENITLTFTLNGAPVSMETKPGKRVLDLLRADLGLTAAKEGCGSGECGACAILVDGTARLSCLMLAAQLEGREVVTAEGLGTAEHPHPIQASFAQNGAVQCGYCTPGMTIASAEFLARTPAPDRGEVREAISGNLCRCTGYVKIVGRGDGRGQGHARGGLVTRAVRCPASLAQLWPLLEDGATVMAGGTDLLARRRGQAPALMACLERIESLYGVSEKDGVIRLGACETHARLLRHPLVRGRLSVLAGALAVLGSPLIRNMGTLGGNIVTASPAGDTLAPLYALDAQVELASRLGTRRVPLAGFIEGPGRTRLEPEEIVAAVLAPPPDASALQHFEKVGRRKALAISVVSLAAVILTDSDGVVSAVRLAVGSAGPTVVRCVQAERSLTGRRLEREALLAAGQALRLEITPMDDLRASAAYRRDVAGNLLLRLAQ